MSVSWPSIIRSSYTILPSVHQGRTEKGWYSIEVQMHARACVLAIVPVRPHGLRGPLGIFDLLMQMRCGAVASTAISPVLQPMQIAQGLKGMTIITGFRIIVMRPRYFSDLHAIFCIRQVVQDSLHDFWRRHGDMRVIDFCYDYAVIEHFSNDFSATSGFRIVAHKSNLQILCSGNVPEGCIHGMLYSCQPASHNFKPANRDLVPAKIKSHSLGKQAACHTACISMPSARHVQVRKAALRLDAAEHVDLVGRNCAAGLRHGRSRLRPFAFHANGGNERDRQGEEERTDESQILVHCPFSKRLRAIAIVGSTLWPRSAVSRPWTV